MCEEIGRKNVENVDRLRPATMKEIFVTSRINLLALYNKDVVRSHPRSPTTPNPIPPTFTFSSPMSSLL